ncbi:MAG: GGDEF domain-containing protein [Dehalococcoidia bacterium]
MPDTASPAPQDGQSRSSPLHRLATRLDGALSISHKLALIFLTMGALVSVLFTWGVYQSRAAQLEADLEQRGLLIARSMEGLLSAETSVAELQEELAALADTDTGVLAADVYALDGNGTTIIASADASNLGDERFPQAAQDARASIASEAVLRHTELAGAGAVAAYVQIHLAIPDDTASGVDPPSTEGDEATPDLVLGVYLSSAERDEALHDLLVSQVISVGIALLLIPVVVYLPLRVFLLRRLRRLLGAAHRLGEGDYSARVEGPLPATSSDEMMELSARFNDMAASIEGLHRELSEMATTDALSGLYNRRYAFEALEREVRLARRGGRPLAIVLADVDSLKKLNDRYGHAIGDEVLKRSAGALRNAVRVTDIAARIGGDEFLAVLPDCDAGSLRRVLARIQESMEPLGVPEMPGPVPLTMSTGAAVLGAGDDATTLMQRADLALYEAKRAGKNQTRVAA